MPIPEGKLKKEKNTLDHRVRCCPSEALSTYWRTLAHTSWFKRHPILSATSPTKLSCLGMLKKHEDDENDGEREKVMMMMSNIPLFFFQ